MSQDHIRYGEVLEAAKLGGIATEDMFAGITHLLEEGRFMALGFDLPDDFLATIDLSRFQVPRSARVALERAAAEAGATQRAIAGTVGVDPATVNRDLKPPVANATQEIFEPINPQVNEPIEAEFVANATPEIMEARKPDPPPSTRELLAQSDQNDWRTPRKFLDAARRVLGAIDLDPASSAEANETVQASIFYTEDDDGLKQPWKGRVWLNPPYGGQARGFIERLIREYEVGNVSAGLALINSHPTETKWFQELFRYSVCFIRGRIDFGGPSREVSTSSTHGSAIAYLGADLDGFVREFTQFGAVVRHV